MALGAMAALAATGLAFYAMGSPNVDGQTWQQLLSDDGSAADPLPIWGRINCTAPERHRQVSRGGEPSGNLAADLLGGTPFRRLTVFDGDDNSGERCELGLNDRYTGPTVLYRERQQRITRLSLRLPRDFPLEAKAWQTVVQMKQTQPSDGGGSSPVIELSAYDGRWHLSVSTGRRQDDWTRWTAPAQRGEWVRFTFDVLYSKHPRVGYVRLLADLNGDGDTADARERTGPHFGTTLKKELRERPPADGMRRGASIPSHLRIGVYHDPAIPCPSGCSIDVDNVEVLGP